MPRQDREEAQKLAELLPAEVEGWTPDGPDGFFSAETLFDLIDGGAEVYRSLNVQAVVSRRYARAGAADIIADVFDMGSSRGAYGAFHHDMREGKAVPIGREAEYLGSNLAFWKDRFFVSIVAFEENEEIGAAVLALGKAVAARILGNGGPPSLVQGLPPGGLIGSQVHYFHDKLLLDCHVRLGPQNILGLSGRTECVLARYRFAGAMAERRAEEKELPPAVLLIVRYPAAEEAQRALTALRGTLLKQGGPDGVAELENGRFAGVALRENILAAVLEAPARGDVLRLTGAALRNTPAEPAQTEGGDR